MSQQIRKAVRKISNLFNQRKEDNTTLHAPEYNAVDFYKAISNFRRNRVEAAISKFVELDLSPEDLSEQIKKFSKENVREIDKLHICNVGFEYILRKARNKIKDVLKLDITVDMYGGEFHIAGNYHTTTFDYNAELLGLLKDEIRDADSKQVEELMKDEFVKAFLECVNTDINEMREIKYESIEEIA